MKNVDILKIPANRIIALILLDIMSIVVAAFTALYIVLTLVLMGFQVSICKNLNELYHTALLLH